MTKKSDMKMNQERRKVRKKDFDRMVEDLLKVSPPKN